MNPTNLLSKTLVTASIALAMVISSTIAFAQGEAQANIKTYTDPVSGELKIAPRLLSEMSEAEKAALTAEEVQFLKQIEALVEQKKKEETK